MAAAGTSFVAAVAYEAYLSSEECAVATPLRVARRVAAAAAGSASGVAGLSPAAAAEIVVGIGTSSSSSSSSSSSAPSPAGALPEDVAERSCLIIGGGVVGVTTAYFLARRGFEVTVLERRRGLGEEASAVNAGWLRRSSGVPLGALDTLGSVVADQLKGLSPWTAMRLWAARFDVGFTATYMRTYWSDITGEGPPKEQQETAPVSSAVVREAALRAAAYDATYFVDWTALLSEHLRFAYCFGARALMEVWQGVVAREAAATSAAAQAHSLEVLSSRSVELLREVVQEEGLDVPLRFGGQLCVLQHGAGKPKYTPVEGTDAWDAERTRKELGYLGSSSLRGALFREEDGIGDCAAFTQQLAKLCRERYGVKFRYGAEVVELQMDDIEGTGRLIGRAQCSDGRRYRAGIFVLANGAGAGPLAQTIVDKHCAKPSPVHLPVCGVRGYSLTLPIEAVPAEHLPSLTRWPCVSFEPSKLVLSVYPGAGREDAPAALRFSAIAEVVASPASVSGLGAAAFATHRAEGHERGAAVLRRKAGEAVPCLKAAIDRAKVVSGLRPQSPDDLPIVSGTRYPNLFVNVGHGGYGWRLACGSAALVADLVDAPEGGTVAGAGAGATQDVPTAVAPTALLGDAWAFSLKRFAGAKLLWRAPPPGPEDCPELSGARVGPLELLMMGPARPPGSG